MVNSFTSKITSRLFLIFVFSSFCFFNYTKSFSQCDEYFINALISGPKESVFQQGSPMRFCPKLRGISLDGFILDVYQWNGYDPQIITVKKDGGIAGTLVLSIKERELSINLIGSPGAQVYSISLNEEEYNDFLINEQQKQTQIAEAKKRIREKINSLQLEEAANIYEGNWLEDKQLFDEIQTKILAIPINKQLGDSESFNLLISTKPATEKFLTLSQGSFTLSSDTISGVTLTENSSGQKFVIDNKAMIIKYGKFDRVNQFQKTLEIKKSNKLIDNSEKLILNSNKKILMKPNGVIYAANLLNTNPRHDEIGYYTPEKYKTINPSLKIDSLKKSQYVLVQKQKSTIFVNNKEVGQIDNEIITGEGKLSKRIPTIITRTTILTSGIFWGALRAIEYLRIP
jgi:hypothetical protein